MCRRVGRKALGGLPEFDVEPERKRYKSIGELEGLPAGGRREGSTAEQLIQGQTAAARWLAKPKSTIQLVAECYISAVPMSRTRGNAGSTSVCEGQEKVRELPTPRLSLVKSPSGPKRHHGKSDQGAMS